uniref:TLC domain-containing protein n=1 Tax=Timema genevievae TaxID=629358 RepID=A0A7R9JY16_TIMGE|nr:unnamed protein product [Timema genevievae]
MSTIEFILDSFWNSQIWLPPNVTWKDIEPNDDIAYANYRHLILPLPMALVMLMFRFTLERYLFAPLGVFLGIKTRKKRQLIPNEALKKVAHVNRKLTHSELVGLSKRLDLSERQVERLLRQQHAQYKPSTLVKFCETSWRFLYYLSSFLFGVFCLWDKPWLWDINNCWTNYPHQSVPDDCWWYYMMSLTFYWALAASQFFDVQRKDFWPMFIHHITTICLLSFSWVCNMVRIGTLVLLIHDCADIFLEAAKMAKYAKYQKTCDGIFVIFALLWIVTRIGIYPFWILHNSIIGAPKLVEMFPAYYIFNSMLLILLFLHVIWTCIILKLAYKFLFSGQCEGDLRSSSSEVEEDSANGLREESIYSHKG